MLTKAETYEDLYGNFGWDIPDIFNMGVDVCDKHALATPSKPGLIVVDPGRPTITYTFADLKRLSDKLANLFTAKGLERGERVGILMS